MSVVPPVRIAVLGYGYWGPNIVRSLLSMPGAELVICCDASHDRLCEAEARFDVAVTQSWQVVLADPSIEAVVVATPARTHRALTLACLEYGKHVLVEKPFATSSRDAEAMFAEAGRLGRALEAGHTFLFNPSVEALREEVKAGALGDVRTAFAVRASHGPRARSDVDIVFDCMVHDVYILQELLGPAAEVSANGASFLTPGVADSASARLSFADGAQAFCYASWCEPVKTRRLTLVGSRAMAEYDDLRLEEPVRIFERGYEPIEGVDGFGNEGLRHFDRGGRAPCVIGQEPLRRELEAFVCRVRGLLPPAVSPESVLAATRTLEAIQASMACGGAPVRVEAIDDEV